MAIRKQSKPKPKVEYDWRPTKRRVKGGHYDNILVPVRTSKKPKPAKLPELLPCPFCGKRLVISPRLFGKGYYPECESMGCPMNLLAISPTKRLATLAANKRSKT